MTFDYYDSLPDEQLKDIARENGVSTQGGRIKIIERLINLHEDLFRQQLEEPLSQVVDLQQLQQTILPPTKPQCQYGSSCYRTSAAHFEEFNHPAQLLSLRQQMQAQTQMLQFQFYNHLDAQQQILLQQQAQAPFPQVVDLQQQQQNVLKLQCPYGMSCYRKNPVHFNQYDHPQELLDQIKLESQQLQQEEPVNGEPKLASAFDYLGQIKAELSSSVYNEFLTIMKEFKNETIDIPTTIKKVIKLFKGNNKLIFGFNAFLPEHHQITDSTLSNNNDDDQVDLISEKLNTTTLNNDEQSSPPRTSQNPLDEARDYVKTIKSRFTNQPAVYRDFLEILHICQKEKWTTKQTYDKVEILFNGHPDLILGFTKFLPDTTQQQPQ